MRNKKLFSAINFPHLEFFKEFEAWVKDKKKMDPDYHKELITFIHKISITRHSVYQNLPVIIQK